MIWVNVCSYATTILFADDTNIFLNGSNLKQMQNAVNKELSNISDWLKADKPEIT